MAQFDLYRNPRGGAYPLLLDVQADVLARLATRVVVPFVSAKRHGARPITRLNPVVLFESKEYVALFQEVAAIPTSALGDRVGSLVDRRSDLIAAIDLLFTGI